MRRKSPPLGRGYQAKSLIGHGIRVGEQNQDAENIQVLNLPQSDAGSNH